MKRCAFILLFSIFSLLFIGCGKEKEVSPQVKPLQHESKRVEEVRDKSEIEEEMKDLTMDMIQKEGKMVEVSPKAVQISPERQQLIGVKLGTVEMKDLEKTIRTVGRIDYNEKVLSTISPKIGGFIEELYVDYTGRYVRKGEPLLTIYSPELVSAQEEYLISLRTIKDLPEMGNSLLESARVRLKLWDITEDQIRALEERGQVKKSLTLHSPFNGYVLEKMAYKGMNVMPGMVLYKIVDLSTVWVYADIYEYELPLIKSGQEASFELSYWPALTFKGKLTYIYPYLDQTTRTAKVRFEFPNSGGRLKPGMYVNVQIKVPLGRVLSVPEGAIIDTGIRKVAIVDKGYGYFEPREVKVGGKVKNYYVVLDGLKEGERVVTSANFLIDSESKFKEAIGAMAGMEHGSHGK